MYASHGALYASDPSHSIPCSWLKMIGITLIRSDTNGAHYFEQGRIVIGSSPASDIRIEADSVRPAHALIQVTQGVVVIQPADRHSLVTIDGIPVSGVHTLADSQSFQIGSIELTVQVDEPEAKTKLNLDRNEILAALASKKNTADLRASRAEGSSPPGVKHSERPARSAPIRQSEGPPNRPSSNTSSALQRPSVHGREAAPDREPRTVDRPESRPADSPAPEERASPLDKTAALSAYEDPEPKSFDSFPSPDDTYELDEGLLETHRLAVSELASAFASVYGSPKPAEINPPTAAKPDTSSPVAASVSEDVFDPFKSAEDKPDSTVEGDLSFESEGEDSAQLDRLELGEASESNTQQLSSQQVASLYKLYKRKTESKPAPDPGLDPGSSAELDAEAFSLSQILLKGPAAFGVQTWDDVAAEAATLQEVSDDPIEGLAKLHNVDDDDTLRKITLGTLVGLMAVVLGLLMMMPNEPILLGQEDDAITDIDVSKLEPVEHMPRAIRCFSEAECVAMATRELEIAKTSWDNRNSDYENRFRAFDHADRARQLLAAQDLEMSKVPELEGTWNQTRDELDAIFQSLRVSFFIALSQKRYEDALETLRLAEVYFPTPRAREKRWAENLKLAMKERGIEAEVNHRRAVRGRWN